MLSASLLLAQADESGDSARFWVAAVTAVVLVLALIFREWHRRREDLDKKVEMAVRASYGHTLQQLRESEASVTAKLEAAATRAGEIEAVLRDRLENSEALSARLQELLEHAADVVPRLDASRPAVPSMLVMQASEADFVTGMEYLSALLSVEEASSDELEHGGTIAQQRFGANAVAIKLYMKAVERNPTNNDALVSLVRLQTRSGQITPSEGLSRAMDLVRQYPLERNPLSETLNLFIDLNNYEGMLRFIDELTDSGRESPLIWRNKAISLSHLGRADDVEEAYEMALTVARRDASVSETSNTVRPYAAFLIARGRVDRAKEILDEALWNDPSDSDLIRLVGDLHVAMGDVSKARWCFEQALQLSQSPGDESRTRRKLQELGLRGQYADHGVVSPPVSA